MHLKVRVSPTATGVAGWDTVVLLTAGTADPSLTDWDTASAASIALEVDTPFTQSAATSLTSGADVQGWPDTVWNGNNFSDGAIPDPAAVFRLTGSGLVPGNSYRLLLAGTWDDDRDVEYTVNGVSAVYDNQVQAGRPYTPEPQAEIIAVATDDGSGNGVLTVTSDYGPGSERNYLAGFEVFDAVAILRKGGTQTFDKPAGIGTITGVTLNGNAITLDSQTVDDFTVTDSDGTITTSGAYDLVATGDTVETISVQVNVVGLPSFHLNENGVDRASLTDVEVIVMTGAAGSRVINQSTAAITTDASGNTGAVEVPDLALDAGDSVFIVVNSASAAAGAAIAVPLELI